MGKNNPRCIRASSHTNQNHVTLGLESLESFWDLQPPARACTTSRRGAEMVKGKRPAYVRQTYQTSHWCSSGSWAGESTK
jgi:hypothetical protein